MVKATVKGLLDAIDPSDPILLMGIADCPLADVPSDVRSWFGFVKSNRVQLQAPSQSQRHDFFAEAIRNLSRKPNEYPDGMPRRKRKLAVLPKAPPRAPRQLTEAELNRQANHDATLREYLKFKLGPIIADLRKKFKRFTRPVGVR